MNICVVGLWHLGTVIAACVADAGFSVVAIDNNEQIIADLRLGKPPVYEPGLAESISNGIKSGLLTFDSSFSTVKQSDIVWITFDTPVDEEDVGDVAFLESKIDQIIDHVSVNTNIVISSQVPVGFTAALAQKMANKYPEKSLRFAYCPENLRLGNAIQVFSKSDRLVVGTTSGELRNDLTPLLNAFTDNIVFMSVASAEMTKHALNVFFALSITFANELASICEKVGADAREVANGLKTDVRIGAKAYLNPGGPFAGGTLARDVGFLSRTAANMDCTVPVISSITDSNNNHRTWIERKVQGFVKNLKDCKIAVLGLTYKPGTNTLRRSNSVELCKRLAREGATVRAFDPALKALPPNLTAIIQLMKSVEEVITGSDILVIATECPEFQNITAEKLVGRMNVAAVIDPSGFLRDKLGTDARVEYMSVGSPCKL